MTCRRCILIACWILLLLPSLRAAEPEDLSGLLNREIVGPALPLAEMQQYCRARMPRMPQLDSVAKWQAEANRLRAAILDRVVFQGEAAKWRDAPDKVQWLETIEGGPGYRIRKLRYEILPGMWTAALLYEPSKLTGRVPVVLNVNGHTGLGKQYPPKQIRCINQAKRGMLALNVEWLGMGQLRGDGYSHFRMNQIDLCGTSGLAPFYLAMKRGLDILLSLEHADPSRVAVTGLSGGGWQTIIISSLDTRVTLCNPVAGYSSLITRTEHFKDLGDSEQVPTDLASLVDYTHLTAMMAPRPTLLTYNSKDDCCFESGYALGPLLEAGKPAFALLGKQDAIRWHVNDDPGTHNFERDNREALYRMLGDFFFPENEAFDAAEIPSDDEVKTIEQLHVELPEPNHDFHTLATSLSKDLPRRSKCPKDPTAAKQWRDDRRAVLRRITRAKDHDVTPVGSDKETHGTLRVTFHRLRIDGTWTIPAVELVQGQPKKTALLLADAGRESVAQEATRLLAAGYRVVAFDPVNLGESAISGNRNIFSLMVASLGDRPLGLQAGQIAAIARWATGKLDTGPITLVAVGPRCTVSALVAAVLEEKAIGHVELHGSLPSLKQVIEHNWTFPQGPELFCFGLLEQFDIEDLTALVAPRPVKSVER